jgi:hypothetical protein
MNDYEKREQEKVDIQKEQRNALRVIAGAAVVSAAADLKKAENTKRIAEETERGRKIKEVEAERAALHRREIAARQEEMLEDQKQTNFRQTILTTLPLLGKEEKNQYVIEQLLPKVIERRQGNGSTFKDVVKIFGFPEFAASFSANPEIEQFLIEDKNQKNGLVKSVQEYINAKTALNQKTKKFGQRITLVTCIVVFVMILYSYKHTLIPDEYGSYEVNNMRYSESSNGGTCWIEFFGLVAFYFIGKPIITLIVENSGPFKSVRDKIKVLQDSAKKKKDEYDLHPAKYIAAWNKIKVNIVDLYLASDSGQKFLKSDMTFLPESSWTKAVSDEQVFLPLSARPQSDAWGVALASQIQGELELAKQRQSKIREILLSRICLIDSNDESSGEIGLYETQAFGLREIDKEFIELDLCRPSDETILPNESGFQKGRIFIEAIKLQSNQP